MHVFLSTCVTVLGPGAEFPGNAFPEASPPTHLPRLWPRPAVGPHGVKMATDSKIDGFPRFVVGTIFAHQLYAMFQTHRWCVFRQFFCFMFGAFMAGVVVQFAFTSL